MDYVKWIRVQATFLQNSKGPLEFRSRIGEEERCNDEKHISAHAEIPLYI